MTQEFNLGVQPSVEPPYPPWPAEAVAIVEEAIRAAAERLCRSKQRRKRRAAKENDLTLWLQEAVGQLWLTADVPGYSCDTFERPRRGDEVKNYNGKAISKKPDLAFYRLGNPAAVVDPFHDGWFCECKILDPAHSLRDYLRDGIMRFVKGDYAWAMPAAQMIGYVRQPSDGDANTRLLTFMGNRYRRGGKKTCATVARLRTNKTPPCALAGTPPVFATRHGRAFKLSNGAKPGDIELRHLWLQLA